MPSIAKLLIACALFDLDLISNVTAKANTCKIVLSDQKYCSQDTYLESHSKNDSSILRLLQVGYENTLISDKINLVVSCMCNLICNLFKDLHGPSLLLLLALTLLG